METVQKINHFNPQEIRTMTARLVNLLRRVFQQAGNRGSASGIFPIVGRGDGSLDDSYRMAQPDDSLRDYHLTMNARQPKEGPFYVYTHTNRYERRGVLVPDITGLSQPGSNESIYEREVLTRLTTELLLNVAFQLDHQPGLILPQSEQHAQVIPPEAALSHLLKQLEATKNHTSENGFVTCLKSIKQMSAGLEFAVVISDFMSSGWEQRLINIGRRLELVVFQIVDPWDIELPDLGQVSIDQGGQKVLINTSRKHVRANYQRRALEQQAHIKSVLQQAKAQHYTLQTTKPLLDQLEDIFQHTRRAA